MKILYVPDVADWAIGGLVKAKVTHTPYNRNMIIPIHPRDAGEKASWFLSEVKNFNPDIIVYEYFRSCQQLIHNQPELKNWKSILVHHNQKDKSLFHADWNELGIKVIVTHTAKCRQKLMDKGYTNVETINHGIDLSTFTYSDVEPEIPTIGYVGRVVPWKGLKEIAESAVELNYPVLMMGKLDKMDYWETVPKEKLQFDFMGCSNEERPNAYRNMTIYVGNSEDDYEEGTLPFLEAMACGVPVVTTLNGVANDIIRHEYNALVVPFQDKEALKAAIKRLMEDKELRATLRKNAWDTVRNMPEQKMAYQYSKLFNNLMHGDELVSAIIPSTYDRKDNVHEILKSLNAQTYKHIEAIVIWDEAVYDATIMQEFRRMTDDLNITVKQFVSGEENYGLAKSRNIGIIESEGKYLLFCDSRLCPEPEAVHMFVVAMENVEVPKVWLFGNKGSDKKAFVENFSFAKRAEIIKFGMMNERINMYGGMSQEIRTRWKGQGGVFEYIQDAHARQLQGSGMNDKKRQEIIKMKMLLLKMYEGENH